MKYTHTRARVYLLCSDLTGEFLEFLYDMVISNNGIIIINSFATRLNDRMKKYPKSFGL